MVVARPRGRRARGLATVCYSAIRAFRRMSDSIKAPKTRHRPWREIADEVTQEIDGAKLARLLQELVDALEEEGIHLQPKRRR